MVAPQRPAVACSDWLGHVELASGVAQQFIDALAFFFLPFLGSIQRAKLHPSTNRRIGACCDECLSDCERTVSSDLPEWRIADARFVVSVNVCTSAEKQLDNLEMSVIGSV